MNSTCKGWADGPQTRRLVWALRGASCDGDINNDNSRMLGRDGVMCANLVASP